MVGRGSPVHCRMLNSIPGLNPLDASSISIPYCDNQKCLEYCKMSPGGNIVPGFQYSSCKSQKTKNYLLRSSLQLRLDQLLGTVT